MVLTKEAIDAVQLTRRFGRSYDASEVDTLLDEIADAAEDQRQELERLRSVQEEYTRMKDKIAETLIFAQQTAAEIVEQARVKGNAELAVIRQKKDALLREVSTLERCKLLAELEKLRNDLVNPLDDPNLPERPRSNPAALTGPPII